MSNIKDISDRYKKRRYDVERCKGCDVLITDEYTEVVLPSATNDDEVTHIALCPDCTKIAEEHGAF